MRAYNNHDYLALSPYLVPGHVNYFGHRYASPSFIRNDMTNDARTYAAVNCTYYPDQNPKRTVPVFVSFPGLSARRGKRPQPRV